MIKIIKKTMLATLLTLWSIAASALDMEIVPASTLKGPAGTIINVIGDLSKKEEFNIIAKQMGNCGEAVNYFNTTKNPIGILWSNNMYKNTLETKQNCIINFEEAKPVAIAWFTYDVCVRKDFVLEPGKTYTLGNVLTNPGKSITENLNNNNKNIKFKNVTFEGSAQIAAGLVNKDIDVGYIATNNAAPAIKAGSIKCLYSTGSTKYGQKSVSEFTGTKDAMNEFKVGQMLFVRNLSKEQIIKLEKSLISEFESSLERQDFVNLKVGIDKEYLDNFIQMAKDYVRYQ